jgi:hypothetical protein
MERLVRFAGLSLTIAVVVTVCSLGLAAQVGAISLTTSSTQFLGSITPDGGSETEEAVQITHLVNMATGSETFDGNDYVRTGNSCGDCPDATAVGSVKEDTSGDNTGDFGSGFTYLKAKYDQDQGGALVWYVAGLTGEFDVPSAFGTCGNNEGCGISHWVLFNPGTNVAEPSTTLLAGLAFAGIAFIGRKLKVFPRA